MLEFSWPILLIFLPLPLLMRVIKPVEKQEVALRVPFFHRFNKKNTQSTKVVTQGVLKKAILWLMWIFSIIALASPQWTGEATKLPSTGRDLLLAVDISGSMREPDMVYNMTRITRLTAVKQVVGNFVERRKSDRLGLVLFGTQAFLQAPLTYDVKTVQQFLYEAQSGYAGEATAIGDAIVLSIKRLRENSQNQRVLILLTDGQNTAGAINIDTAIDIAVKANTRVYAIGFSPYDREVDSQSLQALADKTGGQYFRARTTNDLNDIHHQLDLLEPIEQDAETFRPVLSLFYWPLGIAFFLSLLLASISIIGSLKNYRFNKSKTSSTVTQATK